MTKFPQLPLVDYSITQLIKDSHRYCTLLDPLNRQCYMGEKEKAHRLAVLSNRICAYIGQFNPNAYSLDPQSRGYVGSDKPQEHFIAALFSLFMAPLYDRKLQGFDSLVLEVLKNERELAIGIIKDYARFVLTDEDLDLIEGRTEKTPRIQ